MDFINFKTIGDLDEGNFQKFVETQYGIAIQMLHPKTGKEYYINLTEGLKRIFKKIMEGKELETNDQLKIIFIGEKDNKEHTGKIKNFEVYIIRDKGFKSFTSDYLKEIPYKDILGKLS